MHNYAGNSAKKNPSATYLFWMVSDTTLTCAIEVCDDGNLWVSVRSLFVCVWVSFDSLLDSGTALQRWPNIDCSHFHLNKPFLCVTCPLTSARKIINFSSAHTLVIELTLATLCHPCSFEYTNSETQGHRLLHHWMDWDENLAWMDGLVIKHRHVPFQCVLYPRRVHKHIGFYFMIIVPLPHHIGDVL